MIRNITNTSSSTIVLTDINGLTIDAGETVDGLAFGEILFKNSIDLIYHLQAGTIILNDGSLNYAGSAAVASIQGVSGKTTRDGTQIYTASDRPRDHFRVYAGSGDDIVNGIRNEGNSLLFDVEPLSTKTVNIRFCDDVYVRDGFVQFENANFGSSLDAHFIAPAGVPYPSYDKKGTLDLVGGSFVPNTSGTGLYKINPSAETVFAKFIDRMWLFGTNVLDINSPEPVLLFKPYFLRFNVTNTSDTLAIKAAIVMGLFRTNPA